MIKFLDIQRITESFEPELSEAINRVVKRGWFLLGAAGERNRFLVSYIRVAKLLVFCGIQFEINIPPGDRG